MALHGDGGEYRSSRADTHRNQVRRRSSLVLSLVFHGGRRGRDKYVSQAELTERTPVSHSDEQLQSVLETLEECRRVLNACNSRESAEMLSIVILDVRMKLKGIDSADLKALCDEMLRSAASEPPPPSKQTQDQPRRPLLRVVK
ncbi:hypothetical protein [Bradyrhizobium sp. LMG 9283]|uniref:hypothetical protein n=1 Tax=Bradyrhizobium sp. LMG 9283 TaxID=592064 RepID=UPI00388F0E8F